MILSKIREDIEDLLERCEYELLDDHLDILISHLEYSLEDVDSYSQLTPKEQEIISEEYYDKYISNYYIWINSLGEEIHVDDMTEEYAKNVLKILMKNERYQETIKKMII